MRVRLIILLAFLTVLPPRMFAQATTGSISGTVIDQSSAVLPGVTITVRHTDTGRERIQVTDEHGRYRVLDLTPGAYELRDRKSVV